MRNILISPLKRSNSGISQTNSIWAESPHDITPKQTSIIFPTHYGRTETSSSNCRLVLACNCFVDGLASLLFGGFVVGFGPWNGKRFVVCVCLVEEALELRRRLTNFGRLGLLPCLFYIFGWFRKGRCSVPAPVSCAYPTVKGRDCCEDVAGGI